MLLDVMLGLESGWIERRTGIRALRWIAPDTALTALAIVSELIPGRKNAW